MFISNGNKEDLRCDCVEWSQQEAHEREVRKIMAEQGYRIMHRRNGEYWIMYDTPKTLAQIGAWIERQLASN